VSGFRREVLFEAGYDHVVNPCRPEGCGHGRHGLTIRFVLHGERASTVFVMYATDWLPSIVDERLGLVQIGSSPAVHGPVARDLATHWRAPFPDHTVVAREHCEFLDGEPCGYDGGSALGAERVLILLLNGGSDAVWDALEERHEDDVAAVTDAR
jgi:hypothetical protein